MATFTFDTIAYGSSEQSIFFALAAAEFGAKVAIISETDHIGGLTGGMLGVQDFGNPLTRIKGLYERYLRFVAFEYGLRDSRLVIPGQAEQIFMQMLARAGVEIFHSERLASAVLDGSNKITSVTMVSGNVFQATTWFDGSLCSDLVQLVGTEGVTWQIGTEHADTYSESKGGYHTLIANGSAYDEPSVLNVLAMPDPGLPTGDAYDGVQAYAHRVIYAPLGQCTLFDQATITPLGGGTAISVTDPSHYDPDDFVFYGLLQRAGERGVEIPKLSGAGRGFMPNSLIQDNDDIPLVAAGRPRHWDYSKLNVLDPAATYASRAQLEYDLKLFMMQSRAWMQTDSRYSGAWQNSAANWGWPQRWFRGGADGIPWQVYVREGVRPKGDYVLAQDDLTVLDDMAPRSIYKDDAVGLAGYAFDTHVTAYSPVGTSTDQYRLIGKTPSGEPDTYRGGYEIPWSSCFNSARPNLLHVPSCSHLAWSSMRIVINLCLAAEACGVANQYLLGGTLPASVNIATLQGLLTARGLLIEPDHDA